MNWDADENFSKTVLVALKKEAKKNEASEQNEEYLKRAKKVTSIFKFICPSYFVPREQE